MARSQIKVPQYRQLYETLRKQITNRVYKAGDLLPSEHELSLAHTVTQPTIRQALALLVNDGYIKKHQGKGSIVLELPKGLGILSIEGRLANSENDGDNLTTRIIDGPRLTKWPADMIFTPSQAELKRSCFYIERQRKVNNIVVFYEILYIVNQNLPKFASKSLENKSLYALLSKSYEIEIKGGEQKIWSIAADIKTSNYLEIQLGSPVLRLERRIDTNRENFSIYTSLYVNTERYLLQGQI
ncbi:GntR family transcriptional regulator [Pedobacter frigiditerrae]|uniref:GntR family transcriptional regulator n=1 Tax=Pedobacter frigiditerrae TaxID=2530452 RepID=A0A4V2MI24_9SPHI|nr:GntR family transcriptional regulator [Pedobacter frigiditerrae]TCC88706.1 GntR family transcriptional regulator [Pedobacter frigiditerrae]